MNNFNKADAKLLLKRYNIIVCVGSWIVVLSAIIPLIFSAAVRQKLSFEQSLDFDDKDYYNEANIDIESGNQVRNRHKMLKTDGRIESGHWIQWQNGKAIVRKEPVSAVLEKKLNSLSSTLIEKQQLSVVVQVSLLVCLIFSFAMIGYAAYALDFLLNIHFDYSVFSAYSLLYCGVTIIIIVVYGFWASSVDFPQALWAQTTIFIPIISIGVIASASLSLGLLPRASEKVMESYNSGELKFYKYYDNTKIIQDTVELQLLVEGLMEFSVLLFQLVCYISFKELYMMQLRVDNIALQIHELIMIISDKSIVLNSRSHALSAAHHNPFEKFYEHISRPTNESDLSHRNLGSKPRKLSPWASAEWMKEISLMASRPFHFPSMSNYIQKDEKLDFFEEDITVDVLHGGMSFSCFYNLAIFHRPRTEHLHGARSIFIAMLQYRKWLLINNMSALSTMDKVLVLWGVIVGFIFVYLKGTFVIFSSWVGDSSSPVWIVSLWRVMALTDKRYSTSDDFLVSTEGFLALIVGPMALLFAWSICSRSSLRHPLGIFCTSADLYTLLVSVAIQIRSKFQSISFSNMTLFVFLYIILNLARLCSSLTVLVVESRHIVHKVEAYSHHHQHHYHHQIAPTAK